MRRPPISAERLASLPPEMRAILVEVIAYYESQQYNIASINSKQRTLH